MSLRLIQGARVKKRSIAAKWATSRDLTTIIEPYATVSQPQLHLHLALIAPTLLFSRTAWLYRRKIQKKNWFFVLIVNVEMFLNING